jgi:D-alanyl-lipoteichoic acid acyltransferase DltB (MBOAT superfamily)
LFLGAKALLVMASLFYYAWWKLEYLPVILLSLLFNYVVGNQLTNGNVRKSISRKVALVFGIAANLALLGYFKYSNFLIENINYLAGSSIVLSDLALPLAISFFTFQQIAYLVDCYKKEAGEYDFLNYALFVTFFPQLIAGPIVHHKEMMPQFSNVWNLVIRHKNIAVGLFIFSIGLFKKVILADTLSQWAKLGFDKAEYLNMMEAWVTSLSYTFQLYFDFSGYTDMAVGAALLFNIRLPVNFNSPYKALDIRDFWRRWHITLSRFMRDYIYIPLGGNRLGSFRTYSNLFVTFVIGGLWHGAGWTFLFWGALHGMALSIHRFWSGFGIRLPRYIAWFITFNFINIGWVFFRAHSWSDALKVLKGMFLGDLILPEHLMVRWGFLQNYGVHFGEKLVHLGGFSTPYAWLILAFIIIIQRNSLQLASNFTASYRTLSVTAFLACYAILNMSKATDFLYFNF